MLFVVPNSFGSPLAESNDCHSPAGSSAGGQFCATKTVYVGMSVDAAQKVQGEGLKIGRNFDRRGRPPSVYVTTSYKKALYYANWHGLSRGADGYFHGDVAIVRVAIPKAVWKSKAIEDEHDDAHSFRLEQDLPPEWITGIDVIGDSGALKPLPKRARESNTCHTPSGSSAGGQFCGTVKRGWHLTADPHFVADPTRRPALNSLAGDLIENPPAGIFVGDPEFWMHAFGYERPYVAELEGEVTNPPGVVMHKGREEFMQGTVRTVRVLTIDEYARETYGETGWVEEYFSNAPRFSDRKMPKGYVGRPVSDMTPAEIAEWERKFGAYAKRPR